MFCKNGLRIHIYQKKKYLVFLKQYVMVIYATMIDVGMIEVIVIIVVFI